MARGLGGGPGGRLRPRGAPAAADATGTACPADADPTVTLGFPDLRRYSVLQVSKDAGIPVVFLAAILIVLGLLAALYTSRRKLWVRAAARGSGSRLEMGGFALQRRTQFDEEFAKLAAACVAAAGGEVRPEREPVP